MLEKECKKEFLLNVLWLEIEELAKLAFSLVIQQKTAFPDKEIPSIFDYYCANVTVDRKPISLGLWDPCGPTEYYDRLRPLTYSKADVFIMCFSVISHDSFESIKSMWLFEVRHYCPTVPIILVGTKIELREDFETIQELNSQGLSPITPQQGNEFAKEINAICYVECSAFTRKNLNVVFNAAIRAVLQPKLSNKKANQCNIM